MKNLCKNQSLLQQECYPVLCYFGKTEAMNFIDGNINLASESKELQYKIPFQS